MKPRHEQPIRIVGAGLAGALLAIMLARRGFGVTVFERRSDPRSAETERGRSINLALAARGMRALEAAGLMDRVRPLLIPMRGRMVHDRAGGTSLHPYGQREHEVIFSVSRADLNRLLIEEAAQHPSVTLRFGHHCLGADVSRDVLRFRDAQAQAEYELPLTPAIAADGAGSAVRASLAFGGHVVAREDFLDHDYKELSIPAVAGKHALEPRALHVWPRGGYMLIALPNTDGSFTATLFLARKGESSFTALSAPGKAWEFFSREFPDAIALMPAFTEEFRSHPQGQLGTVHTASFHAGGRVLLLGDAAHAIVPFHGQGMNAAFEDCLVLESLLERSPDWESLFTAFSDVRMPDTEAIAKMAIENYTEMRHTVLDSKFVRQKQLALELESRFPERFIPRYAMVMFHPEIPYGEALRRGAIQAGILEEVDASAGRSGQYDFALAERLITQRLTPAR